MSMGVQVCPLCETYLALERASLVRRTLGWHELYRDLHVPTFD